jgi:uncharacterized protein YkwD
MRIALAVGILLGIALVGCSDDESNTQTSSLEAIQGSRIPGSEVLGATEAANDAADQTFLNLINAERTTPVAWSNDLAAYAEAHLAWMVANQNLAHSDLANSHLLGRWSVLGENIGYGPTEAAIHFAYMASGGHRANILLPDFTHVGSASVKSGDTLWTIQVYGG